MIGFSIVNLGAIGGIAPNRADPGAVAIAKAGGRGTMAALKADESLQGVWGRAAVFAALYAVAMVAGIALTRFGAQVAPVWVASAVLAWALVTTEQRHWPIYLGLTMIAHIASAIIVGDQAELEIVYLIANMSSPLLLASLMRWRGDTLAFADRDEAFRFLLIGGFLAPGVSTAIVALASAAGIVVFEPRSAITWFFADGLSFLVFLPLINVLATNGWRALLRPGSRRRTFALFAVLLAAFAMSWFLTAASYRIFLMLLIPYLIYIAFDLGMTAARAALAISSALLMSHALFAPAPFDRIAEPQQYLISVQIFVAVMVASVLPIATALAERQRLYETASQALQDAQEAWGQLLAAEARFQFANENPNDLILRMDGTGVIVSASPSSSSLRQGEDLAGANLADMAHPDDAARVRDTIAALLAGGAAGSNGFWQLRLRDMNDDWVMFDADASLSAPGELVVVLRAASL